MQIQQFSIDMCDDDTSSRNFDISDPKMNWGRKLKATKTLPCVWEELKESEIT